MPAFRTSLSDTDIADLVAYFHSGKCCVEGENPPANPWYRAETQKWPVQSGLTGGATGTVRIASGDSPEGVGVQLVAPNGVRTTVYTECRRQIRIPQDASRVIYLAHSNSCSIQALSERFGLDQWRYEARRHRAGEGCRLGQSACHTGAGISAQQRGDPVEFAGHGRRKSNVAEELLRMPFLAADFQESL